MKKPKEYFSVYECEGFRNPSIFRFRIESSPKNIAAFIASAPFTANYALLDQSGECRLTTMGRFADLIEDPYFREQILDYLIPMQMGEAKIPKVKYEKTQRVKTFDDRKR